MTTLLKTLTAAALLTTALTALPMQAEAGGVLRLDEVTIGELDPAKASDYADSILMFNIYDTLVLPRQGGPGHVAASGRKLGRLGQDLHLQVAV